MVLNGADPRDLKTYYSHVTLFRRIMVPVARGLFSGVAKWQATGMEGFPAKGPVVLAANHLTNMDVFFLQFSLPRPIYFMGKEELFRNPLMDWMLRQLGGFPVQRGAHDEWAIRYAEGVLERGQVLGIFPEGTRNRGQGLRPAKTGMARLAQTANCPILPVAIHGTQYLFKHLPRRTPIRVTFGEPVTSQPGETVINLTERVMFALAELLPVEGRGAYRYRPPDF
jgi:1-acyl-sn-glycerol-3-phosphate acyltransferase